jgi:hypothetical protein
MRSEVKCRTNNVVKAVAKTYLSFKRHVSTQELIDFMFEIRIFNNINYKEKQAVSNILAHASDSNGRCFQLSGYDDHRNAIWELNTNNEWNE